MSSKTITITRALKELKTLASRIEKLIAETTFIYLVEKPGQMPAGFKDVKDIEQNIKSNYQALKDLIEYRNKVKQAIVNSNATTMVTIAGKQYTVAAAIETKNSIAFKIQLLRALRRNLENVEERKKWLDTQVSNKLDELLKTTYQGKIDIGECDYNAVSKPYLERNQAIVVDPLSLINLTSELHREVEEFLNNVDDVISVSNAITTIEV